MDEHPRSTDTNPGQLLIQSGNVDILTNPGNWTPLHLAIAKGSSCCIQRLIRHEASVHARQEGRRTPLDVAVRKIQNLELRWQLVGYKCSDEHNNICPYFRTASHERKQGTRGPNLPDLPQKRETGPRASMNRELATISSTATQSDMC